jgi:hypothetical protein
MHPFPSSESSLYILIRCDRKGFTLRGKIDHIFPSRGFAMVLWYPYWSLA